MNLTETAYIRSERYIEWGKMRQRTLFFTFLVVMSLALASSYQTTSATPKKASNITCQISSQTITYGQAVNISGRLTDSLTGLGLRRLINLTYSQDNGTTWIELKESWGKLDEWGDPVWTTEDGYYGPYEWTPEHIPHNFLVKASWNGDETYEASESTIQTLKVELPPSPPVVILSHRSYVFGSLWIAGEIQNVGTTNIEGVIIATVYYNSAGTIIGTDNVYAGGINLLTPGQKSPFINYAGISYPSPINSSLIDSYAIVVGAYEPTTKEPPNKNLEIVGPLSWYDAYGGYHVTGQIKNNGTITASSIKAVATFYGANNTLVDAWFDFADPEDLHPNDVGAFDIELYSGVVDVIGPIDHYNLQVDCYLVEIYASPPAVIMGDSVTVSGQVAPRLEQVNVTLTYIKPDATIMTRNVTTTTYGFFNDTFVPDQVGIWNVSASWPGDMGNPGASSWASFNVTKAWSSISCAVPPKIKLGESITVTGSMSPVLEGANVTLNFTKPDGTFFSEVVITTSDGAFAYPFKPQNCGIWYVQASWPGDANYEGDISSVYSFSVETIVAPVRETPSIQTASAALAVGTGMTVGLTTLMSVSGLARSFNSLIEKLGIPDWLKDFLKFYAEEKFKFLTKEEAEAVKRKRIKLRRQLACLVFCAAILLLVFTYVEVDGFPNFLDTGVLLATLPSILASVVLVFVATQLLMVMAARTLKVWGEFKVWLYGLASLLVTGILLMVPFASPGRMDYEGELSKGKAGITAILSIVCSLTLAIPFYFFYVLGYVTLADAGLLVTMMAACYSAFPFNPLDGEAVFRYNKVVWLVTFTSCFVLFLSVLFNILPHIVYLAAGVVATALFVALLWMSKRF